MEIAATISPITPELKGITIDVDKQRLESAIFKYENQIKSCLDNNASIFYNTGN